MNIIAKFNLFKFTDKLANQIHNYIHFNNLKFDIIHAHFTYPAGSIGNILKNYYCKPLIITGHGFDVYSLPFRSSNWGVVIQTVLKGADHIITVSHRNLECLRNFDIPTPISIIPNGFRSDLFYKLDKIECRTTHNLPLDKKIIMTVCNLDPIKGLDNLIKALPCIISKRNDVISVIIGSGVCKSNLENLTHQLELDNHVKFIDRQPHSTIPTWINACDLFVLPSTNEGNPTVMFEALACGKPFLGTRVGGIPEVITFDDYGLLVEPANPEDLAEKILIALDRDWNQQKILDHAAQYTWEKIAKQIMDVYRQVIEENPR